MFHLGDGQHRVSFRVDAPVGDVNSLEAKKILEQQALDRGEGPLDGLLGPSRQMHPIPLMRDVLCG